jgi:hypothetical protein
MNLSRPSDRSRLSLLASLRACVEACGHSSLLLLPILTIHIHPHTLPHISHHAVQTLLARRFGNYNSTVLTRTSASHR